MATLKLIVICSVLSIAVAGSSHQDYAPAYKASDYYSHPQYKFDYGVKDPHTGDYKSQWEAREGDVVKGSYSVVDPDGTVRTVDYTADGHNGFNAVVKKTGAATHAHLVKPVAPVLSQVPNVVTKPVYLSPAKPLLKPQPRPVTYLYATAPKAPAPAPLPIHNSVSAYPSLPAAGPVSYPAPPPALPHSLPAPQPQIAYTQAQLTGLTDVYAQQPLEVAAPYPGVPAPQQLYNAAPQQLYNAAPAPPDPITYQQLYHARLANTAAAAYGSSVPGASQQANNPGPVLFPVNPEDQTPPPPRNLPPQFTLYQQGSAAVRAGSTVAAVNTAINQINQNQQQQQQQQFLPPRQQIQYAQLPPQHLQPQNVILGQAY